MNLASKIKNPLPTSTGPAWAGPEKDGITFSLLSRFLQCRERFRVLTIEGLKPHEHFEPRMGYGNMWHVCEEALAAKADWRPFLLEYCRGLTQEFPLDQEKIDHWYNVCRIQFPIYVSYWSGHPDVLQRTPLLQEQMFNVAYQLPSGRTVRLRGKWDSVDLIGKGKDTGIWIQENKTKADIDEELMKRNLSFDLQTLLYVVALQEEYRNFYPIKGIRYNVIRRPLSGGIGTIKQTQNETRDEFYDRLKGYIDGTGLDGKKQPTPGPSYYFMRWSVPLTQYDIDRFKTRCLNPILEQLCHWYDHQSGACDSTEACYGIPPSNWQHPFGIQNSIDEYGYSDVDNYLLTGSEVGLKRVTTLFPELA